MFADRPLQIIAMDFTLLDTASNGLENVLLMTDVYTNFALAVLTRDQWATTTMKAMVKESLLCYGAPQGIHSDQGQNFEADLIKELLFIRPRGQGPPHTIHRATASVRGLLRHSIIY